jgi:hypothetical protein
MELFVNEQKSLTREFAVGYWTKKAKVGKFRLLTEFISAARFNRKYAIGILSSKGRTTLLRLNGKLVKTHILHNTWNKRIYEKRCGPEGSAYIIRLC